MEADRRCDPAGALPLTRTLVVIAAVLLLALFGVASYSESMMLPPIDDSDEPGYFEEACWIAEHGGAAGFVRECLRGNYPYYQRHPLVDILASPWARRSVDAVRPMRAVHGAVSVASLAVLFALAWRLTGPEAALLLTALLSLSINWYAKSRVLTAEPVIYAAFFAAWALIAGRLKPRGRWFLAGAALGLAYLAKGTALLILFAFPVAWTAWGALEWRRRRRLASPAGAARRPVLLKPALSFLAGLLLLGGPLLARNAIRFGNPLSNLAGKGIWQDSWTEHVLLYAGELKEQPSLAGYLRTHSLRQIADRLVFGVEKQTPRFLGGLAADKDFGKPAFALTLAASAAILLLGVWRAVRDRASWGGVFTLSLLGVGFCLFTFYARISYASRFMATFAPICGACAFLEGRTLVPRVRRSLRLPSWLPLAAAAFALVLLAGRTRWSELTPPRGPVPTTPEYRWLLEWHQREVMQAGKVCFQTPYLAPRYAFHWLLTGPGKIFPMPATATFEELQRYMDSKGATYMVVERDSLRERLQLFEGFFRYDPSGQLVLVRPPPGWELFVTDPYPSADFFIFKRHEQGSAAHGAADRVAQEARPRTAQTVLA